MCFFLKIFVFDLAVISKIMSRTKLPSMMQPWYAQFSVPPFRYGKACLNSGNLFLDDFLDKF